MSEETATDEQKIAEVAEEMSKMHRIRVSNTKKPFIFYLNLAKYGLTLNRSVSGC
ncbi:putative Alba-like domain superfamily protein [Helianthus annuus]|nr:putative Alba-like domain superfamily protein [Helianthus annuus]